MKKRKITKQMLMLWGVGMLGIIVLTVSVFAVVLSTQRIYFGAHINLSYVNSITLHQGPDSPHRLIWSDDMFLGTRPSYELATRQILHDLHRGGRTNQLNQIFQPGGATAGTVTWAMPELRSVLNIRNRSRQHFVHITFRENENQWAIRDLPNGLFELVCASEEFPETDTIRPVYQIFILLGNVSNRFEQQTWGLSTATAPNDSVQFQFTTWGNYHRLASYTLNFQGPLVR